MFHPHAFISVWMDGHMVAWMDALRYVINSAYIHHNYIMETLLLE